jgi:hypothetical protein
MSNQQKIKQLLQSGEIENVKIGIALAYGKGLHEQDIAAILLPDTRAAFTGFKFELNDFKIKLEDRPMDDLETDAYASIAGKASELCCIVILETPFGTVKKSSKVYYYTQLAYVLMQFLELCIQSETDKLPVVYEEGKTITQL